MSYESDQAAKRAAYARGMLNDEAYSLQSRPRSEADTRRSAAIHSAEREVLEAGLKALKAYEEYMTKYPTKSDEANALLSKNLNDTGSVHRDALCRYRALLDGKEAT